MRSSGQRLIANTGYMYAKMGISAFTGILSSRYILHALGVTDYGIYSVVLGVTAFLGFINDAMVIGTQRFMAYSQGKNDLFESRRIFNTCLVVHALIALVVIIAVETFGVWFLRNKLTIPIDRMPSAELTLQCALIMSVVSILSVPYNALMSSHEAFKWISILGVIQSILTLGVALLLNVIRGDLLVWYAALLTGLSILAAAASAIYCHLNYRESSLDFKNNWSKSLAREIIAFSSWNLFGVLSGVARSQGIVFLFNIFFGPKVNAAYGLANQATGMLGQISGAMLRAISPQIVKSEGAGYRKKVIDLAYSACRLAFLLDALWIVPLYAEMPFILKLWLTKVPLHTVEFCRLVLIGFALEKLTISIVTVVQAVGRIALYQVVMGSIMLLTLPIGYLLLKEGYSPEHVLFASVLILASVNIVRMLFASKLAGASFFSWIKCVVIPAVLSILPSITIMLILLSTITAHTIRLPYTLVFGATINVLGVWFIGLRETERKQIKTAIVGVSGRLRPR